MNVTFLILVHAALGGIALLAGAISLIATKGRRWHRTSGSVFYYALLASVILSLGVALTPSHYNPFLFQVGLFSIYFLVQGKRGLLYGRVDHRFHYDRLLHVLMCAVGIAMVGWAFTLPQGIHQVSLAFGLFAIGISVSSLRALRTEQRVRQQWLLWHIRGMVGGYIAATTAFLVVNQWLPGISNWFVPGIVGGAIIAWHAHRVRSRAASAIAALLVLCAALPGMAQDASPLPHERELSVQIGITRTTVQDGRLSGSAVRKWSPKYDLTLHSQQAKSRSRLELSFSRARKAKADDFFAITSFIGQVNYTYLRHAGSGIWVGGSSRNLTLLNFPVSRTNFFGNNPISYTLAKSLGPALAYTHTSGTQEPLRTDATLDLPLLAYVVQPIFGHPYPARYMREGTFSPTRSGIAGAIVTSGKVVGPKRYRNLRLRLGISYDVSPSFRVGMAYHNEAIHANSRGKAVRLHTHDVLFSAGYLGR
jgi:hypothetical protein